MPHKLWFPVSISSSYRSLNTQHFLTHGVCWNTLSYGHVLATTVVVFQLWFVKVKVIEIVVVLTILYVRLPVRARRMAMISVCGINFDVCRANRNTYFLLIIAFVTAPRCGNPPHLLVEWYRPTPSLSRLLACKKTDPRGPHRSLRRRRVGVRIS